MLRSKSFRLMSFISVIVVFFTLFGEIDSQIFKKSAEDDLGLPPVKLVFGNVGYGQYDIWAAAGFRYTFFGISAGLSAFNKGLPEYRRDTMIREKDVGYTESHTTLVLHVEASGYYDFSEKISGFVTLGYYWQKDSVLARPYNLTDTYLYRYKTEMYSGLCFGLGFQYFFDNQIAGGIGYQSKNGFYLQVGYYWE